MRMADAEAKILVVLREALGSPELTGTAALGVTPRWDSMRHMKIVFALERAFGVTVGAENVAELISVPKILAFLRGKLELRD